MEHSSDARVPRERWGAFLDELNDTCRGLRARIECAPVSGPSRVVAADSPFAGIVEGEEGLVIELAGGLSFAVGVPQSITNLETGGPGQTITFETSSGQRTILALAGGATLSRAVGAAENDSLTAVGGSAGAAGGSSAASDVRGRGDDEQRDER